MSRPHFQIAVLGSGFAGSLVAMIARRQGFSVVMIERGKHPRFVIGESSTPLANLLLEEICDTYNLPAIRPLCKWGTWQRELPHLGCGLKRGFTFYHHAPGKNFSPDPNRERQLLVGASPNETVADTHWYRPDFDHYFAKQAEALGVVHSDETELSNAVEETDGVKFTGQRHGKSFEVTADFVVDATGPRGFLFRQFKLPEKNLAAQFPTQALFSHFRNVGALPENFSTPDRPPYPPEQAAVHHVFPGGWVWVLKFNNGITSAGVAATDTVANELKFSDGERAWQRFLTRFPAVQEIFGAAQATIPFVHLPRVAFRSEVVTGARWALLPSAAGFIDPLLSTGFPLTLLGVKRIADILHGYWQKPTFAPELKIYAQRTLQEQEAAATLVEALYATMDRFDLFRDLTRLYFAAASFAESARRLGKPSLADSFLLCRNPIFAEPFQKICRAAKTNLFAAATAELKRDITHAIEPFDVIGMNDRARNHWHPALADDLFRNRAKLGATEADIRAMLRKCGLGESD